MRAAWRLKRIRVYAYTAFLLLAVFAAEVAYFGVRVAGASSRDVTVVGPLRPDERPLPTIAGPSTTSRTDLRLTEVARDLGVAGAEVRCWAPDDWARIASGAAGYARGTRVNLPSGVCNALLGFPRTRSLTRASHDLLLLAHELQHAGGVSDEAIAECYGLQSVESLALALGADAELAVLVAYLAWRVNYREDLLKYRSPECHNRGALDLRPATNDWP